MRKFHFILLALTMGAIWSCSQDMDELEMLQPSTRANSVIFDSEYITANCDSIVDSRVYLSAVLQSNALDSPIKTKGFMYSLQDPNPRYGGTSVVRRTASKNEGDTIHLDFKVSKRDTYIYYRAFCITELSDTIYSKVDSTVIAATPPAITTLAVDNRARVAAIALGRFTTIGDEELLNYGVCLNKKGFPTLDDTYLSAVDYATDETYNGTFGVWFDGLEPMTLYHIRAFCVYKKSKDQENDTIYGNERVFRTTRGGNVKWSWSDKSNASRDQISRIEVAMDSACYYYNNYSNLTHDIHVSYNAGVPTADCNILGSMRYGANERYQWVGTAQHEMSHAMGIGTASNWGSFGDPWSKPVAALSLKVMMQDMTIILHGAYSGQQHFWPGGINQKEEVTNGTKNNKGVTFKDEHMLKLNAMMCNAMRIDGLYGWWE